MNHWLKRVAIAAPPLIIAGVYFRVIPVGPVMQQKLDRMIGAPGTSESKPLSPAKILSVKGEVYMKERPGFPLTKVRGNEVVQTGTSLATGDNSSALLHYDGKTSWKFRVGPNSQVNIDELSAQTDKVTMMLVQGSLLAKVEKRGKTEKISIRTKYASFAVRGTTFTVLSDGTTKTLMTVKEGVVEAENFKTTDKNLVRDAHTYIVNREGDKKIALDLDSLDLYNWNPEDLEAAPPTMESVLQKTGDVGPTPDENERARQNVLREIDNEIREFKNKNDELNRELGILRENAEQSREGLRQEIRRVEKDIRCIETSKFECNLLSEKILMARGFPRLWGNPKYRHSMVVDLQKYLQERDAEVDGREEEANILSDLMKKRTEVLREVEALRSQEKDLDKLIPALQDARLKR